MFRNLDLRIKQGNLIYMWIKFLNNHELVLTPNCLMLNMKNYTRMKDIKTFLIVVISNKVYLNNFLTDVFWVKNTKKFIYIQQVG